MPVRNEKTQLHQQNPVRSEKPHFERRATRLTFPKFRLYRFTLFIRLTPYQNGKRRVQLEITHFEQKKKTLVRSEKRHFERKATKLTFLKHFAYINFFLTLNNRFNGKTPVRTEEP